MGYQHAFIVTRVPIPKVCTPLQLTCNRTNLGPRVPIYMYMYMYDTGNSPESTVIGLLCSLCTCTCTLQVAQYEAAKRCFGGMYMYYNVKCDHSFSAMNRIKMEPKNRLKTSTLHFLMGISIEGLPLKEFNSGRASDI